MNIDVHTFQQRSRQYFTVGILLATLMLVGSGCSDDKKNPTPTSVPTSSESVVETVGQIDKSIIQKLKEQLAALERLKEKQVKDSADLAAAVERAQATELEKAKELEKAVQLANAAKASAEARAKNAEVKAANVTQDSAATITSGASKAADYQVAIQKLEAKVEALEKLPTPAPVASIPKPKLENLSEIWPRIPAKDGGFGFGASLETVSLNSSNEILHFASSNGLTPAPIEDGIQLAGRTGGISGISRNNFETSKALLAVLSRLQFELDSDRQDLKPIDLVFLLDCTPIMSSALNSFNDAMADISKALIDINKKHPLQVGVISFGFKKSDIAFTFDRFHGPADLGVVFNTLRQGSKPECAADSSAQGTALFDALFKVSMPGSDFQWRPQSYRKAIIVSHDRPSSYAVAPAEDKLIKLVFDWTGPSGRNLALYPIIQNQ